MTWRRKTGLYFSPFTRARAQSSQNTLQSERVTVDDACNFWHSTNEGILQQLPRAQNIPKCKQIIKRPTVPGSGNWTQPLLTSARQGVGAVRLQSHAERLFTVYQNTRSQRWFRHQRTNRVVASTFRHWRKDFIWAVWFHGSQEIC